MIDQSDKGPIKQRLIAILNSNADKKITAEEIRVVLGKPWHAQSIAQLITRHESEWLWNPAKWDELDDLMEHRSAEPNLDWAEEKKRIKTLSWWKELGGKHGLNTDGAAWHLHPLATITPEAVDSREIRVRAFLRMIRVGEGTVGSSGYEKLFGGSSFIKDHGKTFDDHPQIKINKSGYTSSAAGAYQVMGYTWSDTSVIKIRKKLGIRDFTPLSQDKLCVALLKFKVRKDALDLVIKENIKEAIEVCSWEWASLPPGRYGQPIETMDQALENYSIFLQEEKDGKSDLHLAPGFLKEFGY
ncbi:hypothetical protein D3C78_1046820 [compost metagenome]